MRTTDPTEVLHHISRHGIEHSERELAALAATANRLGVLPAIVSLLTDRSAAAIVRERAAARVAAAVLAVPPAPSWSVAA